MSRKNNSGCACDSPIADVLFDGWDGTCRRCGLDCSSHLMDHSAKFKFSDEDLQALIDNARDMSDAEYDSNIKLIETVFKYVTEINRLDYDEDIPRKYNDRTKMLRKQLYHFIEYTALSNPSISTDDLTDLAEQAFTYYSED